MAVAAAGNSWCGHVRLKGRKNMLKGGMEQITAELMEFYTILVFTRS
jgi:hypothetical protein